MIIYRPGLLSGGSSHSLAHAETRVALIHLKHWKHELNVWFGIIKTMCLIIRMDFTEIWFFTLLVWFVIQGYANIPAVMFHRYMSKHCSPSHLNPRLGQGVMILPSPPSGVLPQTSPILPLPAAESQDYWILDHILLELTCPWLILMTKFGCSQTD